MSSVLPANNHSDRTILVSGFAALAFTHLFALTPVAGWHLDEAWAGNFAHRIAFEKGFWPFQAMSPYTAAWSHYLAAIAFRLFGTSVLVYRATGILEVLIGIGLLTAALAAYGEKRAAAFLPWIIAFFPTLVMNHRWVIEMNTFFALCVGLIAYGMSKKKDSLIYAGALWGITSHILFLAPCLALLYWCWSNGRLSRQQKAGIAILSAVLAIFFLRIFLKTVSDDHKKAIVLIFLSVFTVFGVFIPFPSEKFKKYFLFIPVVFAAPLMFPFLLFAEGSWVALFSSGKLQTPLLIGTFFIPIVLLFYCSKKKFFPEILWLPYCLILTLLMVVKPGPRYYEVPFLFCAILLAIGLSRTKKYEPFLALWIVFGSLQLGFNYFQPSLAQAQIDRTFRLWRFHDSSSDMLPSQRVALRLSREGCEYGDLKLSDNRMDECLKFLSYGDWPAPAPHHCSFGTQVDVLRIPGNEGQFTIKAVGPTFP